MFVAILFIRNLCWVHFEYVPNIFASAVILPLFAQMFSLIERCALMQCRMNVPSLAGSKPVLPNPSCAKSVLSFLYLNCSLSNQLFGQSSPFRLLLHVQCQFRSSLSGRVRAVRCWLRSLPGPSTRASLCICILCILLF